MISDYQARLLYARIAFFRGKHVGNHKQKAVPFNADRIRKQLAELNPQTRRNYLDVIGEKGLA